MFLDPNVDLKTPTGETVKSGLQMFYRISC